MTRFPGGYFRTSDGGVDIALDASMPVHMPMLFRFSGEHLAALTAACLKAFREGGGRLFDEPANDQLNALRAQLGAAQKTLRKMGTR